MLTSTIESHVTSVLAHGAAEKFDSQKDKLFKYRLLSSDFSKTLKTGVCRVMNRYYDITVDCDIITYQDVNTGEQASVNQFRLHLEESEDGTWQK